MAVNANLRRGRVALFVLATLWSPFALGAELFQNPTPAEISAFAAARPKSGATRERAVAVDPAAVAEGAVAPVLEIELFPGVSARFRTARTEPASGGGSVIEAEAGDRGDATLVAKGGRVTGRVLLGGKLYAIRPLGGRIHAVSEISRAALPPPGPERLAPQKTRAGAAAAPARAWGAPAAAQWAPDIAAIDVLFVYTAKAKAAAGDIRAEIDLAVAVTNQAYKASGVKMRMRLVKAMQSGDYDEDLRDYNGVLDDLTGHGALAAAFDPARKARDKVGADMVVLLREGGGYCGLAWVVTEPAGADAWTFAEVSRGDCVAADTVAHEVGHNMGLRHDRYVTKDADGAEFPSSQYNFGYVSVPARAMDVMAYENRCWDAGVACEYKRLFSSPNLRVRGRMFGVPEGKPRAADAVRWLNEIRWIAHDLRPTGGTRAATTAAD